MKRLFHLFWQWGNLLRGFWENKIVPLLRFKLMTLTLTLIIFFMRLSNPWQQGFTTYLGLIKKCFLHISWKKCLPIRYSFILGSPRAFYEPQFSINCLACPKGVKCIPKEPWPPKRTQTKQIALSTPHSQERSMVTAFIKALPEGNGGWRRSLWSPERLRPTARVLWHKTWPFCSWPWSDLQSWGQFYEQPFRWGVSAERGKPFLLPCVWPGLRQSQLEWWFVDFLVWASLFVYIPLLQ